MSQSDLSACVHLTVVLTDVDGRCGRQAELATVLPQLSSAHKYIRQIEQKNDALRKGFEHTMERLKRYICV